MPRRQLTGHNSTVVVNIGCNHPVKYEASDDYDEVRTAWYSAVRGGSTPFVTFVDLYGSCITVLATSIVAVEQIVDEERS